MKEMISILNFGQVIAYLIPGFIGVYALSRVSTFLRKLVDLTFDDSFKLQGIMILFLMSMAIGLLISAIRSIFVDKWVTKSNRLDFKLDYSKLCNNDIRVAYDTIVQNSWRFTQYYGNMCIATLMLFCFNMAIIYVPRIKDYWLLSVFFFGAIIILFLAYQNEFKRTSLLTHAVLGGNN